MYETTRAMEPAIELANLAVDGTQVRLIYSHASVDQLENTILVAYSTLAVFSAQVGNISGSAHSRTPSTHNLPNNPSTEIFGQLSPKHRGDLGPVFGRR